MEKDAQKSQVCSPIVTLHATSQLKFHLQIFILTSKLSEQLDEKYERLEQQLADFKTQYELQDVKFKGKRIQVPYVAISALACPGINLFSLYKSVASSIIICVFWPVLTYNLANTRAARAGAARQQTGISTAVQDAFSHHRAARNTIE